MFYKVSSDQASAGIILSLAFLENGWILPKSLTQKFITALKME